ncbi:hypothetical protein GPECTOR_64g87 [Gonium pectorale]|uniref:Uncharacterized protein n=1 Tax=Gonium pectorale TaxID=33097 RepID=A0A150G4B7_GONPE|nr:hypothetical protein GPECTOR_64g87 [Gonium pectorale]|eukprot:KXZ44668.1 hypothetical protein GPECTOR_64g87 [Gonium pectorale]
MALYMSPAALLLERLLLQASIRSWKAVPLLAGAAQVEAVAQAYVEASTSYAVLQQSIAYALVLGGEGIYTRPEVKPVAGGVAATALVCGLVALNNDALFTPAFVVGLLASGAMLAYNIKRTIDTKQDESDWPGPKAWPATMSLISFFALNVFIQAIKSEL